MSPSAFVQEADCAERVIVLKTRHPGVTSFVIVASPHDDTIDEAVWFGRQLVEHRVSVQAAIVNRAHPQFGAGSADDAAQAAEAASGTLAELWGNVRDLRRLREAEMDTLAALAEVVGGERLVVLPLLDHDVHDLDGLHAIADHLFDVSSGER